MGEETTGVTYNLYTAVWSKASQELLEVIKTFGPQFIPDKQFVMLPLEQFPNTHEMVAIRVYPTITKNVNGVEVARKVGTIDLIGLVEFTKD